VAVDVVVARVLAAVAGAPHIVAVVTVAIAVVINAWLLCCAAVTKCVPRGRQLP